MVVVSADAFRRALAHARDTPSPESLAALWRALERSGWAECPAPRSGSTGARYTVLPELAVLETLLDVVRERDVVVRLRHAVASDHEDGSPQRVSLELASGCAIILQRGAGPTAWEVVHYRDAAGVTIVEPDSAPPPSSALATLLSQLYEVLGQLPVWCGLDQPGLEGGPWPQPTAEVRAMLERTAAVAPQVLASCLRRSSRSVLPPSTLASCEHDAGKLLDTLLALAAGTLRAVGRTAHDDQSVTLALSDGSALVCWIDDEGTPYGIDTLLLASGDAVSVEPLEPVERTPIRFANFTLITQLIWDLLERGA